MQEIWRLPASEVAYLVRSQQISASEATSSAIRRLEEINPQINAVVDYDIERSLTEAKNVDRRIACGEDPGLLAGVPITVKANVDQAGFATTNGTRALRNHIADVDNPVIANMRLAGAIVIGRTNTPAFSYRWFTDNQLYGRTCNPHDPNITPGGSSGGAAAATAAGIGHIAHGTDIIGSIRYPAYACGVHGLRPSLGRVPTYNPSLPERRLSVQISAVSGPLARTIRDLRIALTSMSKRDPRDPWWVPAPLVGPAVPRRAALCPRPDGLDTAPEVIDAVIDAGQRLEDAGWTVDEVDNTPPLLEAAELQRKFWLGDGYEAMLEAAELENDIGALVFLRNSRDHVTPLDANAFSAILTRRATLTRKWQLFLQEYPILVTPPSGELPFPDQLDLKDCESAEEIWHAQMPQVGIPFMGLPALTVSTGKVGRVPVGVQLVSDRYREDLCLLAGEALEHDYARLTPIDPAT